MHCDTLRKQLDFCELQLSWEVRAKSWALAFQRRNLYLILLFVQIPVPRVLLCRIHPVSVLIPSVLRELVGTAVWRPLPPHQNCPCCEVRLLSQCVVLSDLLSTLKSQFCCHHLHGLTLCSPLMVFDVFGYCPPFFQEITDVLVSVSLDQESPLTSLWLHRRMRMLARFLKCYLLTSSLRWLTGFILLRRRGFWLRILGWCCGNLNESMQRSGFKCSSYVGLYKRGRSGRFRCGDHGVKSHGIQCCRHPPCWFLKTAYCSASHDSSCCAEQMLITECIASQPEAGYPWLHKLVDIRSKTAREDLFPQWKNLFSVFLSTSLLVPSHSCVPCHIVSRENPCCVSDRPRKPLVNVLSMQKTGFCLWSLPDMFWQVHVLWRRLSPLLHCSDRRICQSCPSGRHSFATLSSSDCGTPSLSPCRHKRSYSRSRTHLAVVATT